MGAPRAVVDYQAQRHRTPGATTARHDIDELLPLLRNVLSCRESRIQPEDATSWAGTRIY
ncbi:hypothetical protein Pa4123_55320 [Phytohabitans aurantiacus]|uniref:Integrase SAM-like N-terminal domain-containing protein n=1 Tax=Phytohabitans aurantiacus TaxID=3016789 RepID=A0ABQ5R0J8_9ACTN|nr:hypothetical protein Pa4123_55320 [Phytohabitans aurantiacus]